MKNATGQSVASYGIQQRDAQRRRAIKRQLRRCGVEPLPAVLYDTNALRALRREVLS